MLGTDVALAIHDQQLSEHNGGVGVRDIGALESALARPVNQWTYGEDDLCVLAVAYAYGVARNHPFVDGNKRTVWVLARSFLRLNRQSISFTPRGATNTVIALALVNSLRMNWPTGSAPIWRTPKFCLRSQGCLSMGLFKWRGVFGVGDEWKSLPNGTGSGRAGA